MNLAIGLAAIWTALYSFGAVMEWLTQHDLLMPVAGTALAVVGRQKSKHNMGRR